MHARKLSDAPNDTGHKRGRMRLFFAALFSTLMAVTGAITLPVAAVAAPNAAIIVDQVVVGAGSGPDGQLIVGDTVSVSGAWDATEADPREGDTFTIGMPDELQVPADVPFNLMGPRPDGSEAVWASCYISAGDNAAECTLTAEVEEFPELVSGEFSFDVEAVAVTSEEALTFNLNGEDVEVPLPGNGGIGDGVVLPTDWTKSGQMNSNNWSMTWTIDLPGSRLAGADAITIDDSLSDSHQLCDPANLTVHTVRGDTVVDNVSDIAEIVPGENPHQFGIALTAPEEAGFNANVIYRISYETCTTSGEIDPAGTEYTNEAHVWGETSGVIGVEAKPWHDSLSKSGTVLGGAARYGQVEWTVTVPGDLLQGGRSFTLEDELGAGHEVLESTVSDMKVEEQYGPSGQRKRNITGDLIITAEQSTSDSFTASLQLKDAAPDFRPSDYRYVITYTTSVTQTDLPAAGTTYGNVVTINGETAKGSAEVPGRTDRKNGAINGSKTTLDGVEYLPQTTMTWNITVPGERLADVHSDLVITDELSQTHQVCDAGDPTEGLASQLGLRVQARDQVRNGGLATVDLTDSVIAAVDGQQLTFTVPQPELPMPGGETVTGFSVEYDFVFEYTTCTTSGGMDAPGTVYGNSAVVNGKTYTSSVTQNHRGSGSGAGVARGSVSIVKSLADTAGAAFVPSDAFFTVHVQEFDPQGVMQIEYDLDVPLDGTPVSGPNSRGRGWTAVLTEPAFPQIPGVAFGIPQFAEGDNVTLEDDGASAVIALTPGSNIDVSLVNTAQLGSVSLVKELDGAASGLVDPDRQYSVTAQVDTSALGEGFPAQADREIELTAGEPVVVDNLPIGAVVTFSESRPADDDLLTWGSPVFSPETITVTADHVGSPAEVVLTNSVERTVGTFSLSKTVTGEQATNPEVPDAVTVTATWDDNGTPMEKNLTLPTDGTPVEFGEKLLIGTEVTLTETPLVDGSSIAWASPAWSGDGVTIDGTSAIVTISRDAAATVNLENHAATSEAGLQLIKGVAGEASGEVDPETEFPVVATWTDADGVEQSRELNINSLTPTSLGETLPAGTVVTITEGEHPQIDTVVWGSITINGTDVTDNGDGSAQVVISDQEGDTTLVTVTNEATWAPGTFSVTKNVSGVLLDNPDVPTDVTVVASWFDAGEPVSETITVPTDGTTVAFGTDLPHGTHVTLAEEPLADGAAFHWLAPTWEADGATVNDDDTVTIVIGAATDLAVGLTNHAEASLGDLTIVKSLDGDGAAEVAPGTEFPVTATWTDLLGDQQQVEVNVTADEPTVLTGMPLGTEVTLSEKAGTLPSTVTWAGAAWSAPSDNATLSGDGAKVTLVVTDAPDASAAVTLTNTIERLPDLAVTGGATIAAGGIALVLALLGGGLLLLRSRERQA